MDRGRDRRVVKQGDRWPERVAPSNDAGSLMLHGLSSSCGRWELLLVVVHRLFIAVFFVMEHGL